MEKKTNKNNLINTEKIPKKRGRPAGSVNKSKISRPDRTVQTNPGENSRFLLHDLKLMNLPDIDINNAEQMKTRVNDYFRICSDDDVKPSIASLALSFGVSRVTLFSWITGKTNALQNAAALNTLKRAYDSINSYYEHMMNNGKINPVAGIFLMKNNMGYQDTTNYVISADNNKELNIDDITNRSGLLEE
jgi:hypothetical protein